MKPSTKIPRKKKKMALYEVLSKGVSNSRQRQGLEGQPVGVSQVQRKQAKPRAVQFNRGRFEVSLRYDVAIVIGLLFILCLMGAYRFGEYSSIKENATVQDEDMMMTTSEPVTNTAMPVTEPERTAVEEESGGDNWIVIATHQSKGQLAPVQQYFEGYGVETQIRKVAGVYILHTKRTFGNPNRAGSDGEKMRRQIIEIGKGYEPPSGYRSFDFSTAYGKKKLN